MKKSNAARVRQLWKKAAKPRFGLGAKVKEPYGGVGAVDAIFADLEAAINAGVIGDKWYDGLDARPKTLPTGVWYSVVLDDGAVMAGEQDLTRA